MFESTLVGMNGDAHQVSILTIKDLNENGFSGQNFYPYEVLKNAEHLPANVDPTRKEVHFYDLSFI